MTKVATQLTTRETEIIGLIREGLTGKEIAAHLDISQDTVKKHLANILNRLNALNGVHAVVISIRCGFIELEGGEICQVD
ncbi:MAG: helix-turn-helix transcriptional regulator [Proteobacteria bacterium]|nr:helix-turn-helix transcriptional regulator [Patescibacteria group bacterium]MBU1173056.1 helix-turn-helix transcriptional regulator [Pseudomonadota bacterium]